MKRQPLWSLWGGLVAATAVGWVAFPNTAKQSSPPTRTVLVTETLKMIPQPGQRRLRVWIPLPATNPAQEVKLVGVHAPWPYRLTQDPEFGNPLVFIEGSAPMPEPLEITLQYQVTRSQQRGWRASRPSQEPDEEVSHLYRTPRGLIVVNDTVQQIARAVTNKRTDPIPKARALYDYVLTHMRYDKTGTGWGRGDVRYACHVGKGNCTDFHSLFIALCLASRIPARFQMGFPLPEAPAGTIESPYHCWAEFFAKPHGWVPVDISEAWKSPDKKDYYFGALDPNRVLLTTGRELRLSPRQHGPPLNYLARPYVELDGVPFSQIDVERRYQNLNKEGGTHT